ncbi:MAG: hypothetical protein EOM87_05530 [Clostridia bacterium]|nr:hypothetical protein [Clostridia bacterium]
MLNFGIGIMLFAVSTYFGLYYRRRCRLRAQLYAELYEFSLYLTEQISYSKTPLPLIFSTFSLGKNTEFAALLLEYSKEFEQKEPTEYALKHINDREKSEILSFFRGLGKTDVDNQIKKLSEQKQWIKNKKEITQTEETTKGKLYFKLAVIIGIALLIIVI